VDDATEDENKEVDRDESIDFSMSRIEEYEHRFDRKFYFFYNI